MPRHRPHLTHRAEDRKHPFVTVRPVDVFPEQLIGAAKAVLPQRALPHRHFAGRGERMTGRKWGKAANRKQVLDALGLRCATERAGSSKVSGIPEHFTSPKVDRRQEETAADHFSHHILGDKERQSPPGAPAEPAAQHLFACPVPGSPRPLHYFMDERGRAILFPTILAT